MDNRDSDPAAPPVTPTLGHRLLFAWFAFWAVLITIPVSIIQLTTHQFWPTARNFRRWAGWWGGWILGGVGVRVRTRDDGQLDASRPYVFVSNHQNALDILALSCGLPYPFGFVAKSELERVPFLGFAVRNSACVFIDRSDPRRSLKSIKEAAERIRAGHSVLLFPEGTRSYSPVLAPFKKGAFLLAVEAGVPLVPVTVIDSYRLLDERRRLVRPGTIHVRVGEPLDLAGLTRRDVPALMETVRERMEEMVGR